MKLFLLIPVICIGLLLPENSDARNNYIVNIEKAFFIPEIPGDTMVAFSLKALYKKITEAKNEEIDYHLGGITSIAGYISDNENNDIVLFGKKEKNRPALQTINFIIALKNAFYKYNKEINNVSYFEYPGCSIDPDPKVFGQLNSLQSGLNKAPSEAQINSILQQWIDICQMPQSVRIMGIPFDSEFAYIMLKADYDMKSLVDGTDTLDIDGYKSLMAMRMDEINKYFNNEVKTMPPVSGMNRFWFRQDSTTFNEAQGIVSIKKCKVILSTEKEKISGSKMVSAGTKDFLAENFVICFSEHYNDIARLRPIYADLKELFNLVAIAKAMKFHEKDFTFQMEAFLGINAKSNTQLYKDLPGKPSVRRIEKRNQGSVLKLWLPSCGGVTIDIDPNKNDFSNDNNLAGLKASILGSRKNGDDQSWIIEEKPEDEIDVVNISSTAEDEQITLESGSKQVKISKSELNTKGNIILYDLFGKKGKVPVLLNFNNDLISKDVEVIYSGISKQFPEIDFYLATDRQKALDNYKAIPSINQKNDIEFHLVKKSFGTDAEILKKLEFMAADAGIDLKDEWPRVINSPNCIIITSHKESNNISYQYLEELGKKGELKGKAILSLACYSEADIKNYSDIIRKYGATEFIYVPEVISLNFADEAAREMINILQQEKGIRLEELFRKAIMNLKTKYKDDKRLERYLFFIKQLSRNRNSLPGFYDYRQAG